MSVGRILAPVDFSDSSRRGLKYAFAAAKAWNATVEVLHASSLPPYVPTTVALSLARGSGSVTVEDLARAQAKEQMDQLLAGVPHDGVIVSPIVDYATPFDAIKAHSAGVDLVVMGTHARTGIDRIFLGSVAEKVVRSLDKPVITVHRDSPATFPPQKILVGVDFSNGAKAAFSLASEISAHFGAELRLLHVIAGIPVLEGAEVLVIATAEGAPAPYYQLARKRAALEMEEFLEGAGRPAFVAVEIGNPAKLILEEAERVGADLIALGTRGRGHLSRLAMGSVAERVVRTSMIPVLTLHQR